MKKYALIYLLILTGWAQDMRDIQPESGSAYSLQQSVYAQNAMVVSANSYASKAGLAILQKGGNALDAAIAMQMVLGVVEPQSSGLGGGGFLLYYQKNQNRVYAYDGRETAPAKVFEEWFLDSDKQSLNFEQAVIGGRSVGVPGLVKMLEEAHQEKGQLAWKELFDSAIQLANNGFIISPRLHLLIKNTPNLDAFPATRTYLFQGQKPKKEGSLLKNPALARSLSLIADFGSAPLYKGELAQQIVRAVQQAPRYPGVLSLDDLANYRPIQRQPLKTSYHGYTIYGFPPPSSGGIVISQMLQMLSTRDLSQYSLGTPEFIHLFCLASRLSVADRDYYLADPGYFPTPVKCLLDPDYLAQRLDESKEVKPGVLAGCSLACCPPLYTAQALELPSTTQICVIDQEGNAVSMTTSIENAFGSTLMVGGFFLNNQLTDFSLIPEQEGKKVANRIEPGKRPMSAMSPTLVFKEGTQDVVITMGSAGGARIPDYVVKTLVGVLDFGMDIQDTIAFPNYASLHEWVDLEEHTELVQEATVLEELGDQVRLMRLTSGTQGIQRTDSALIGGVDPRREGLALGD